MKNFLSLLFFLGVATFVQAQTEVTFAEKTHSFGKIKQHVPVTHTFSFTNTSSRPVVIETATAECGCTTPEHAQGAILKGKTSEIKVTFNSETAGSFKKNITVKFAGIASPYILTIDGEVIQEKK
ncbi:MAG: DUF1573 domain-containing protein [Chitinophagaceae bacterium]|nr:DUF1573 domain-containing protein [Chitinophagaceae bacterium]